MSAEGGGEEFYTGDSDRYPVNGQWWSGAFEAGGNSGRSVNREIGPVKRGRAYADQITHTRIAVIGFRAPEKSLEHRSGLSAHLQSQEARDPIRNRQRVSGGNLRRRHQKPSLSTHHFCQESSRPTVWQ
jgi:hypothetical protein